MPKSQNQKSKLLYIMKTLLEKTDENNTLTAGEIIKELECYGISAERKSIYSDLECLKTFGLDIEVTTDNKYGYYIASREFELPELKLLVDAIQSSKFITHKKSLELIKKIERLTSKQNALQLQRQVYILNRLKTVNETIYYSVDIIHDAIAENKQIKFQYYTWTVDKERYLKNDGDFYSVSPWALSWNEENYYLIAYDKSSNMIKHYRVDKMLKVSVSDNEREGEELFKQFDMALYSRKFFNMFGGEESNVTFLCDNSLIGVIIDRFGKDVVLMKRNGKFEFTTKVVVSPMFFAWVFSLGNKIEILSPDVKEKYLTQISEISKIYEKN